MARRPTFDPFATFVQLRGGEAVRLRRTATFWRRLETTRDDRIIGALHGERPGDFHPEEWEMHPSGDELLYLLRGALDIVVEGPRRERRVALRVGEAFIVPRGLWHRLLMRQPSDLLFCTPPHGTRHRPVAV